MATARMPFSLSGLDLLGSEKTSTLNLQPPALPATLGLAEPSLVSVDARPSLVLLVRGLLHDMARSVVTDAVRRRLTIAAAFLLDDFARGQILDFVRCMDLSDNVEVVALKAGMRLKQFVGSQVGNFFAPVNQTEEDAGIAKGSRTPRLFTVARDFAALLSRAASARDSWTPGRQATGSVAPRLDPATGKYAAVRDAAGAPVAAEIVRGGGWQYIVLPRDLANLQG